MDYRIKNLKLESHLSSMLNINNTLDSLNIFEAQTELMASIINIIITIWFHSPTPATKLITSKSALIKELIDPITNQVIYSMYKMARVLLTSNCKSVINNHNTNCKINQTTNAVSYYIIKVFFYFGLVDLANTCIDKNTGAFIKHHTSTQIIEQVITRGSKSPLISKIMDYLLNTQGPQFKKVKESTARMTCKLFPNSN